jgi:hypothetical protein
MITTLCGSFRIARDGQIRRVSLNPLPVPKGVAWYPSTGLWYKLRHGRLVIGRWQRQLWLSHGQFPRAYEIGAIALGPRALAFSYGNAERLYLARLSGSERRIASGEFPVGWTSGGLYTDRDRGRRLLLRSDSGVLRETLARQVVSYAYDQANGSLYFLAHGTLMRARGSRSQRLWRLARLGLSAGRNLQVQALGRLVALRDEHRLVVLRPDGSLFAATRLPQGRARADGISSSITAAPGARAVSFTATRGNTHASPGTETVYLLRAGGRVAIAVYRERVEFALCERGADVEWHGRWLLYSASEGKLVAIDTGGAHRAIHLSRLLGKLPGTGGDEGNLNFSAAWGL